MLRILYMLVYAGIWAILGFKHVLVQILSIIWSESVALFGRSPTASEIQQSTKSLKKWKHLGCILDHTHFGRNGMLSSAAIAKLGAICVASDSPYTSIFLPRRALPFTSVSYFSSWFAIYSKTRTWYEDRRSRKRIVCPADWTANNDFGFLVQSPPCIFQTSY